jgi:hypothetical protein
MKTILHILTKPDDALAKDLAARQTAQPDTRVEVADLTQGVPDYGAVVEKIFEANSVQVW